MKKIKLLKTIGCIALVATPVIVAPIIMSTSCATTDPEPAPTPTGSITLTGSQGSDKIIAGTGGNIAIVAKTDGTLKAGTIKWDLKIDPSTPAQKLDGITIMDQADSGCKVNVASTVVASTYKVILTAIGEVNDISTTSNELKLTITVDPAAPIVVTSIQGIKLMQGDDAIADKSFSGTAVYETTDVESKNATAEIVLSIEIYFYVNNNPTPVKYTEVKDTISFDFICQACTQVGTELHNVFKIEDNKIVILNDEVTKDVNSTADTKFCNFTETTPPKGYFVFENYSRMFISYGVDGDSEVQVFDLAFQKKA